MEIEEDPPRPAQGQARKRPLPAQGARPPALGNRSAQGSTPPCPRVLPDVARRTGSALFQPMPKTFSTRGPRSARTMALSNRTPRSLPRLAAPGRPCDRLDRGRATQTEPCAQLSALPAGSPGSPRRDADNQAGLPGYSQECCPDPVFPSLLEFASIRDLGPLPLHVLPPAYPCQHLHAGARPVCRGRHDAFYRPWRQACLDCQP